MIPRYASMRSKASSLMRHCRCCKVAPISLPNSVSRSMSGCCKNRLLALVLRWSLRTQQMRSQSSKKYSCKGDDLVLKKYRQLLDNIHAVIFEVHEIRMIQTMIAIQEDFDSTRMRLAVTKSSKRRLSSFCCPSIAASLSVVSKVRNAALMVAYAFPVPGGPYKIWFSGCICVIFCRPLSSIK